MEVPRDYYFDAETSGFKNKIHVTQFSTITAERNIILATTNEYFHCDDKDIEPGAYETHGLFEAKLKGLGNSKFEDKLHSFYTALSCVDTIVGHNISYDIRVIKEYNDKSINDMLDKKIIVDTMTDYLPKVGKEIYKDGRFIKAYPKLSECLNYLINKGVSINSIHEEYSRAFPNIKGGLHNSAYDTFICFKFRTYLLNKGV